MNIFEYKFRKLRELLIFIGFEKNVSGYGCTYNYNGYIFSAYIDEYYGDDGSDICCLSKFVSSDEYQANREKYKWSKLLALTNIEGIDYFEVFCFEEEKMDYENCSEYERKIMELLKKIFVKDIRKNKIKSIGNGN
jgi:hypothetical protein